MDTAKNEAKACNESIFHVLIDSTKVRADLLKGGMALQSNEILDLAKTDHLIWLARINQMFLGNMKLNSADVLDYTHCRLGHWYEGEGKMKYGGTPVYEGLKETHEHFHNLCAEAIDAYNANNEYKVRALLPEIERASQVVLDTLDQLKS